MPAGAASAASARHVSFDGVKERDPEDGVPVRSYPRHPAALSHSGMRQRTVMGFLEENRDLKSTRTIISVAQGVIVFIAIAAIITLLVSPTAKQLHTAWRQTHIEDLEDIIANSNASDRHLAAVIIAGVFAILAAMLSLLEIFGHLKHVYSPELQLYAIRILFIVPLFAGCSWVSLRWANSKAEEYVYVNAVKDVYEAFVIHTFFAFLEACFGTAGKEGSDNLIKALEDKHQVEHPFGLRFILRAPRMGRPFFLFCKYMVLQFVVVKGGLTVFEVVLKALGRLDHGDMTPFTPFWFIVIGINVSQTLALYGLLLFYHALHDDLAPVKPLGKFMSVKLIVFFCFWQSIAIAAAAGGGLFTEAPDWPIDAIVQAVNSFLLCTEMLIAAVLHRRVFSYRDFAGDNQLVHEAKRKRRFGSMVIAVANPVPFWWDTCEMGWYCLKCSCCWTNGGGDREDEDQSEHILRLPFSGRRKGTASDADASNAHAQDSGGVELHAGSGAGRAGQGSTSGGTTVASGDVTHTQRML